MTAGRLTKLKAMPPRELAHRLAYGAFTVLERRAHRRGQFARPDRLRRGLAPEHAAGADWQTCLIARPGGTFFGLGGGIEPLRRRVQADFAPELARARAIAEDVRRHDLAFFGRTFRFGPAIAWHADPESGREWPRRYHRDVPVHGGNTGYGDVKYVWELNRHQFLVDLAKVACLDASRAHAAEVEALVSDWMDAAPYGTGAPWACALEPAFRAWSWLWAYHMLRAADLLAPEAHLRWLAGFLDHGRFLHRHLEYYASPYNHLVGEAAALFALGILFPEFREADRWAARGRQVLETTLGSQFYADGGTVEQSSFYHHATLGFYLLSAVLGRAHDRPLGPAVWRAIERGVAFSMALVQPDGRVPAIGGADDGKPIRLEHLPFWDFRPYQAIGAVLFDRGDFKAAAGRFYEDALWVLGEPGAAAFARLAAAPPATATALEASGYYVARSGWSQDDDYVCFDCGPQAAGLRTDGVPSAAHGHADCLSVIVTLGGRRVLVDPGFFCYNGDPEWEVHFRKTRAHNTITIDGRDQARHVSKMAWTHTYTPRPEGWSGAGDLAWARGSHDGYARGPDGVRHTRTVWLRPDGYVLVYDELTGAGDHTAEVRFQFAPGALVAIGDGRTLYDDRFELTWTCTAETSASITSGAAAATGGWIAPSLGVREPAPRLEITVPFTAPRVALLTAVLDRTRARVAVARTGEPSCLALDVQAGAASDRVLAGPGSPISCLGIDTDAMLAVVRTRADQDPQLARIGGSMLRMAGQGRLPAGAVNPVTPAGVR